MNNNKRIDAIPSSSRRRFVKGLAAGGAVASLGLAGCSSNSVSDKMKPSKKAGGFSHGPELKGKVFNLTIDEQRVNFTGRSRIATAINGTVPAPTLRWKEGETVTLNVTNKMDVTTSIHWHGLILPNGMDGVPGLTFDGIKPGETFTYKFPLIQSGTYWYHSHSGFQEQTGMHGVIVIEPKDPYPYKFDRQYVVSLSDWSDEDPNKIYAKLKKLSHYYNFNERTVVDLIKQIKADGLKSTYNDREMWNNMRMSQRDLSDVTGYTYTYLMNGQTPREGWKGIFKAGEKILLRFANTSAMSFFDVRIPGLRMTVVASDGQYIKPVRIDEFRIGVAETYDVIVEPEADTAYTIFAQSLGRSGYARGTLAPNAAMMAEVPAIDAVPSLTHTDMGMDMSNMSGMDHSGHDMSAMGGGDNMAGGMDCNDPMHASMDACKDKAKKPNGAFKSAMDEKVPAHASTEYGAHIDMRAEAPLLRLNDPGIGLRGNGRQVLTYADIKNLHPTEDKRPPSREIVLHLTGNMARYMWSFNGIKYADAKPVELTFGERVRIVLINDTMMSHPIHMHGLWSELETGDNDYLPKKHTVVVQPGAKISYLVTADAKGRWAYHCHLLYHMGGMFREIKVV